VEIPPLRDRKDDIAALTAAFVRKFTGELKRKLDGVAPDAQKLLARYNWPGNIRELENAIERAVLLTEGPVITVEDLRLGETIAVGGDPGSTAVVRIPPTGVALEDIERQAITEALRMCNWIQRDAGELLHVSARVINYKMKTLRIEKPAGRRPARDEES
jgi:DNA-binding NtrC family response regulator